MKNRATLILMEQLLMILVFAVTAAMCLGIFAEAQQLSGQTARREEAAFLAQNGAELLKSGVSPDRMALPEGYSLQLQKMEGSISGLAVGIITVFWQEEPVFSLETGWQEVLP